MSKMIEEFAKQCTSWSDGGTWSSREEFDHEKFALLIMAECAKACENEQCGTVHSAEDLIKWHFEDV